MSIRPMKLIAIVAAVMLAAPLAAALNGVYTCANGNPGNAFDYGDIGNFFNDLETQGMGGPVTLNVFDDGGPFVSTAAYLLGDGAGLGVTGLGMANPLVIQAALGENPVITGAAAQLVPGSAALGAISFFGAEYTTFEGFEIRNTQSFGMAWHPGNPLTPPRDRIRIARCRIHGVAMGAAIYIRGFQGTRFNAVTIENNMIWDINKPQLVAQAYYIQDPGIEWIIRNNTIYLVQTTAGVSIVYSISGGVIDEIVGNVVHLSSTQVAWVWWGTQASPVLFADYNIYYMAGTVYTAVGTGCRFGPFASTTFAQWQAMGNDLHGQVVDPQLANITPGLEDLHLKPTSPARDFLVPATVSEDIDRDPRPLGIRRDAGADEFGGPDMGVEYAALAVPHLGVLNLGNLPTAGDSFNFTIRNAGLGPLNLAGTPPVLLTPGLNCAATTAVSVQPSLLAIAPVGTAGFTLFIKAAIPGAFDLAISIASNDPSKSPYTFAIVGVGLAVPPPNLPARAQLVAGSTLAGPLNGPFTFLAAPGAALGNASIQLSDPEGDLITVQTIMPPPALPFGVTGPTIPAPGQPLTLAWIGNAAAINPPGAYTWQVEFRDAVNATLISCSVTITIDDPPPSHAPAGATTGTGTQGQPYLGTFNRGDNNFASLSLATLSDANTGQIVSLVTVTPGAHPGVVGFVFSVSLGLLSVSPAATLTVAETGLHSFAAQITDGVNFVDVYVALTVVNTPLNFATASPLPDGELGTAYTMTLQLAGAFGARTYTLTSGALPDSLTMNAATGHISGTPTLAGPFTFEVQAEDATGASATGTFQITITTPAAPPQGKTSDGNNGCQSAQGRTLPAWLLLAALAGLALRRKDRREKAK